MFCVRKDDVRSDGVVDLFIYLFIYLLIKAKGHKGHLNRSKNR